MLNINRTIRTMQSTFIIFRLVLFIDFKNLLVTSILYKKSLALKNLNICYTFDVT